MQLPQRFSFIENAFVPAERATVSIENNTLNYGIGCFEGIRGYYLPKRRIISVFRAREHFERFIHSERALNIHVSEEMIDSYLTIMRQLLRHNSFVCDIYIRPMVLTKTADIGVRLHDCAWNFAMYAIPFQSYTNRQEFSLGSVYWRRPPKNVIPHNTKLTGAYINSALAKTEAHHRGYDDALLLTYDGHVAEASAANIFVVIGNRLITPPPETDILNGITKQTIISCAQWFEFPVEEHPFRQSTLEEADEIFLVGTAMEVMPVTSFDGKKIGAGVPGQMTKTMQNFYHHIVRQEIFVATHPSWYFEVPIE